MTRRNSHWCNPDAAEGFAADEGGCRNNGQPDLLPSGSNALKLVRVVCWWRGVPAFRGSGGREPPRKLNREGLLGNSPGHLYSVWPSRVIANSTSFRAEDEGEMVAVGK